MKRIFSAAAFEAAEGKAARRNNPWVEEYDGMEVNRTSPYGYAPIVGTEWTSCPHWEAMEL